MTEAKGEMAGACLGALCGGLVRVCVHLVPKVSGGGWAAEGGPASLIIIPGHFAHLVYYEGNTKLGGGY
jgi:hypothetical protein